jgi:single-strand DNA-binding protein
MSINRVNLTGNLTRDPELRATAAGMSILSLSIAVNDRVKNQQTGEWEDRPNFFDMAMFGARAEKVAGYLSRGAKVSVDGKLRYRAWETPQGEKRSKVEIVVDDIEFMSDSRVGAPATARPVEDQMREAFPDAVIGEEIPF